MTSDRGHRHQLNATYPSSFQSWTSCSGACGKSQSGAGFACDAARAPSETLGTCTGRTETASPLCECSGDDAVGSRSQSQNCTSETQNMSVISSHSPSQNCTPEIQNMNIISSHSPSQNCTPEMQNMKFINSHVVHLNHECKPQQLSQSVTKLPT